MTEPRSKSEGISETTKAHLVDKFVSVKYGRQSDIQNRYTIKGLAVEEDSISLYSRFTKKYFKKNEVQLENEFITGTPDLYIGESIEAADHIIDLKSNWTIFQYFRTTIKDIDKMYYWQLQGYMALTGAESATLAYCLVDTPDQLIFDEKRKLLWKMGVTTDQDPDYLAACDELDRLMKYEDIPMQEKVLETKIERNEDDIQRLYKRIEYCREYMDIHLFKNTLTN